MYVGKVARRYGKALFGLTTNVEEFTVLELDSFFDAYTHSELGRFLRNPSFRTEDKLTVALEVATQLKLSKTNRNFISLLISRDRINYLEPIIEHYHFLLDKLKGRVSATLTVSNSLNDKRREDIKAAISSLYNNEIVLKEEVDPSIIGGAIVEVAGKVYDGSIRTQLQELKRNITRSF